MVNPKSNRVLPIVAGVVLLMGVFILIKTLSQDENPSLTLQAVPKPGEPDADSPTETLRTLRANVADLTNTTQTLLADNKTLRADNARLLDQRQTLEHSIAHQVQQALNVRENQRQTEQQTANSLISSLTQRVDDLAAMMRSDKTLSTPSSDLPVGLGLEALGTQQELIWHDPLDGSEETPSNGGLLKTSSSLPQVSQVTSASQAKDSAIKAVYTVPENATLIGSTAFTALIGRIPVRGRVQDPWPFKLITGADNLAANGFEIPEVAGMVWSGTAVGDWTLSCVRGQVTSVTFVFHDGTLRTLRSSGHGANSAEAAVSNGVTSDQGLGWLSDRFGVPCLSGQRITNAPAFLSQRAGLLALQAGADAFAQSETTSLVSGQTGTAAGFVSGDTGRFVLGRTLSGGAEEINQWLLERQQQSFDAIFVRSGAEVAIHITQPIEIDYDPQGRRLRHAQTLDTAGSTRLD